MEKDGKLFLNHPCYPLLAGLLNLAFITIPFSINTSQTSLNVAIEDRSKPFILQFFFYLDRLHFISGLFSFSEESVAALLSSSLL